MYALQISQKNQSLEFNTYPLPSMSNILNATEKLDSGMLSSVTKNMYLPQKQVWHKGDLYGKTGDHDKQR